LLGIGAIGWIGKEALYNVEGGHKAVIFHRFTGVSTTVVSDGTHFRIPLIEYPHIFDVRTRAHQISSSTATRDLQTVQVNLRVLTRPISEELPKILTTLGHNYDETVLPSLVHEVLKSVLAQYNAAQLISGREQISRVIRQRLVTRARDFSISLDDVSITHLGFSPLYSHAVEAKQIAQQEVERSKWLVEQAEQDAQSVVVRAEGEAKAAQMIGDAISNNPGYIELKTIDTARDIAAILGQARNNIYLDSNQLLTNTLSGVLTWNSAAPTGVAAGGAAPSTPQHSAYSGPQQ
jgi:prohibitin 2